MKSSCCNAGINALCKKCGMPDEKNSSETTNKVKKERMAKVLNNRPKQCIITAELWAVADASGLVLVYALADNLVVFRGAINNEFRADENIVVYIYRDLKIQGKWMAGEFAWEFKTDIPHATFEIKDGGDKWCKGLVIDLKDVSKLRIKKS